MITTPLTIVPPSGDAALPGRKPELIPLHVGSDREQEQVLINIIQHQLNLDPQALPARRAGRAGIKSEVRRLCEQQHDDGRLIWYSEDKFLKAWQRALDRGAIAESK